MYIKSYNVQITWTCWGWFSPCVPSWWGSNGKIFQKIFQQSLNVSTKVSSYHSCSGAAGWQSTAPASALPTQSTTTTPSRSWAASCSPSLPWSCPTCRTPCQWPYPSLAELSAGKIRINLWKLNLCPTLGTWKCIVEKINVLAKCCLLSGLFCQLPVVVVVERRQLICSFYCPAKGWNQTVQPPWEEQWLHEKSLIEDLG